MKFQNFARSHYDFSVNILAQSQFKMKKKLFLQRLHGYSREDRTKMLKHLNYHKGMLSTPTMLYVLRHAYDFESALRFYVDEVGEITDEMFETDISILLRHSDSIVVETSYFNQIPCTIELTRNTSQLFINGEYPYRVDVVVDVKSVTDGEHPEYHGIKLPVEHFIEPACTVYLSEDFREYIIVMGKHSLMSCKIEESALMSIDESGFLYDVNILKKELSFDENNQLAYNAEGVCASLANLAMRTLAYTAYMYDNRNLLTRKNGKARKPYEHTKVHCVHREPAITEDRLTPLHTFVKEYEPSTYHSPKGGHHASPVEHDRRAYYRRSRGVGDYDLVNGEFVSVGKGKGKYSLVKATHVDGSKKKVTKVYKI